MEDKKILDLYIKANQNKSNIVLKTKDNEEYSTAEIVVLSSIAMLIRSLEDDSKEVDYNKIIKTIILSSLDGKISNLKKEKEYNNLIKSFKELETEEGYGASTTYERMIDSFNTYLNPKYDEEKFVNRNIELHNKTRKGHIYWGVNKDRIENILEHIYGCLVLCIGIESEYNYNVDFNKIMKMLLIHETGEIKIDDITYWDMDPVEKERIEREAVVNILSSLPKGEELINLLDEFNGHYTLESEYAYLIDKLEYDMQVKMYELEGCYDFNNYPENVATNSNEVKEIIKNGADSVFDVHYEYDKKKYTKLPCFRRILEETRKL